MATPGDHNYTMDLYGFPDFVHVPPKKTHYDTWSNVSTSTSTRSSSGCSSSSSPNHHLEELHVEIPHSSTASVASTSNTSQPSCETAANTTVEAAGKPTFTDLQPVAPKALLPHGTNPGLVTTTALPAEVPRLSSFPNPTETGFRAVPTVANPEPSSNARADGSVVPFRPEAIHPDKKGLTAIDETPEITHEARFSSYAEFEEAFEAWKRKCLHPFRVASSETLREPDGTVNHRFKYRYVVFHCAHYGEPRMRGIGKRPNQHYLPSGCRAMLRLNYSFCEQLLKITTLHDEHLNHEISQEMFRKVSAKLKRSSAGISLPAKRQKLSEPVYPVKSSQDDQLSSITAVPLQVLAEVNATTGTSGNALSAQMTMPHSSQMTNMALAIQQQQLMASLLNQQKENINMTLGSSSLGLSRAQPSMMNILGMMGLQQRLLLQQQPAYGLVTPLTPQVSSPSQARSVSTQQKMTDVQQSEQLRTVNKAEFVAPLTTNPNYGVSTATSQLGDSPRGSPPHLVPEAPVAEQVLPLPPAAATLAASLEESLARLRSGAHDAELMNRIAHLNSLTSFWSAPLMTDFR